MYTVCVCVRVPHVKPLSLPVDIKHTHPGVHAESSSLPQIRGICFPSLVYFPCYVVFLLFGDVFHTFWGFWFVSFFFFFSCSSSLLYFNVCMCLGCWRAYFGPVLSSTHGDAMVLHCLLLPLHHNASVSSFCDHRACISLG